MVLHSSNTNKYFKLECIKLIPEDDNIIPVDLAKKLVEAGREAGIQIEFHEFDAGKKYNHKFVPFAS